MNPNQGKAMTEDQVIICDLDEIDTLIKSLKKHANVSKMIGYFDAAYDIMLACRKLEKLSTRLKIESREVSQ